MLKVPGRYTAPDPEQLRVIEGDKLVKAEADNLFCLFDSTADAIAAHRRGAAVELVAEEAGTRDGGSGFHHLHSTLVTAQFLHRRRTGRYIHQNLNIGTSVARALRRRIRSCASS